MLARITRGITRPTLAAEFCLHEPDHAAGLNGSGLLVVNPPWDFVTGTSAWQVQLEQLLGARGGSRVYWLVREGH
jgi:23S rRNA A2030 N6-methylase RlmJ